MEDLKVLKMVPLQKRPREAELDEPILLSVEKVAALLGVTASHVYNLCAEGTLPTVRLGRRVMVNRSKLDEWIEEQTERGIE